MIKRTAVSVLVTAGLLGLASSAPARADVFTCELQGVLVAVSVTAPVIICSMDTSVTHQTTVTISPDVSPHLFAPAP
jgi:hypothetical protein